MGAKRMAEMASVGGDVSSHCAVGGMDVDYQGFWEEVGTYGSSWRLIDVFVSISGEECARIAELGAEF